MNHLGMAARLEASLRSSPVARLTFNDQRRIRPNQHCTSSHSTDWARAAFFVNGNITTHDNCVPPIPAFRLDPIDGIEQRGGGSVTCILVVYPFDVMIS